jgi:hypothetical protein
MMLRFGRRPLGQDPLAKVTSPESGGTGAAAEAGWADDDESALVY